MQYRHHQLCYRCGGLGLLLLLLLVVSASSSSSSDPRMSSASTNRYAGDMPETLEQREPAVSPLDGSEVIVRFYFVRHGRTQANEENLVLGHGDSPLTAQGIQQAQALGKTELIRNQVFWRKYTSDFGRAQATTRLILEHSDDDLPLSAHGVNLEPRLREQAKGAREGMLKEMTHEEAEKLYRIHNGETAPLPLFESEQQVWNRVRSWLLNVVGDAVRQHRRKGDDRRPMVYPVLVVLHSGTLRTTLKNLVGEQLPRSVDLSVAGKDGASARALQIPNTSVTIVDVSPNSLTGEVWDEERSSQNVAEVSDLWRAKLQQLTWTEHYQHV